MRAPASLGIHSAIGLERVRMFTSKIIIQMEDKNIFKQLNAEDEVLRRTSSGKKNEPQVIGEVLEEYFQSNEPLAVAFREWKSKREAAAKAEEESGSPHLLSEIFRHTEPCVDLKLLTCEPGSMPLGAFYDGFLTRDGECHFTFVQNDPERKKMALVRRNPHIYQGRYINVVRKGDGTLCPTFNRPQLSEGFTFQDFCRKAAEELLIVSGLEEE